VFGQLNSLAELNLSSRYLGQDWKSILDFQLLNLSVAQLFTVTHECCPSWMQRHVSTTSILFTAIAAGIRRFLALSHPDSVWFRCTFDDSAENWLALSASLFLVLYSAINTPSDFLKFPCDSQ